MFSFVRAATLIALVVLSSFALGCKTVAPKPSPDTVLGCKSPGSHQDVVKTPVIFIESGPPLKSGTAIVWSATDNDKGEVVLTQTLQSGPGQFVLGLGDYPGQNYDCTAQVKP